MGLNHAFDFGDGVGAAGARDDEVRLLRDESGYHWAQVDGFGGIDL